MAPSAAPAPLAPVSPPPPPKQDDAATKAATDAARAAEKALQKKRRGGRQSLILSNPTAQALGDSGRSTSILGGGSFPA